MTLLRAAALIAVPIGAVGAVGLFLRVALAQRTPPLLVVLSIGWIFYLKGPGGPRLELLSPQYQEIQVSK